MEKGIALYNEQAYSWALEIFSQYISPFSRFHQWNTLYKLELFSWALDFFSENRYDALHNRGNTEYYLGLQKTEKEQKKKYWQQSLESFTGAYKQNPAKSTQANYNFVEKKLRELDPPPDGWRSSDDSEKTLSWSQSEQNKQTTKKEDWEKETSQTSTENSQNQPSWNSQNWAYKLDEKESIKELSPLEKEKVQKYMNQLQEAQERNGQYFNKKPSTSNNNPFENFVDPFTWEPFFEWLQNSEKDW